MSSIVAPLRAQRAENSTPLLITGARHVLRTPLVVKVMGANSIIAVVVLLMLGTGLQRSEESAILVVLAALAIAFVANLLLVRLALSPIAELERVAARVSSGQFAVRAQPSLVADSQLSHLTDTVNSLLDSLAAERCRIQKLGVEVVSTQDIERAHLGRELHDSIAQTLAAVRFQLSAASADATDDNMRNRLSTARGMIGKAMDEVRNISQSLHPRLAEDLGLVTALEQLARHAEERGKLNVGIVADLDDQQISASVAATLFRVAQESLGVAEKRTLAGSVQILLSASGGKIFLEVRDDRPRVDSGTMEPDNSSAGLLAIMDRVELSGGVMRIETGRDGGARVTAELSSAVSV